MNILVTGGAGFIGSHIVDAYLAAGHMVAIVDNFTTGRRANVPPAARVYEMDIRDPALAAVFAREHPDIVNHHAAHISVHGSVTDPVHDASVNVLGTLRVLECARDAGVRKIIYASSGGAAYGEPQHLPCDEAHPSDPLSPYGLSKHTAERYVALYHRLYGMHFTILRYPNVYGPRQDPHGEGGVVAIFSERMLRDEPVTIYGTGAQERDFLAASDVARANVAALTRGHNEIVNCGTGAGTSITQIFETLAAITAYRHTPNHAPARPGEVFRIYLTERKARDVLGWEPVISLEAGLTAVVTAFRSAPEGGG